MLHECVLAICLSVVSTTVEVGDEVVTLTTAPVMQGAKKVAEIEAGAELSVADTRGPWVGVHVTQGTRKVKGWILDRHVAKLTSKNSHKTVSAMRNNDGKIRFVVHEEIIAKLDPGIVEDTLVISPNNKRFAYVVDHGEEMAVVADGVEGSRYERVSAKRPTFSPDSQRLAFAARSNGKWMAVVDGVDGNSYDQFAVNSKIIFSPNSKRFAYLACRDKKYLCVVDGVESRPYLPIALGPYRLAFSPNGQHITHFAMPTQPQQSLTLSGRLQWKLFLDDSEVNVDPSGKAIKIVFSPDGARRAIVASFEGGGMGVISSGTRTHVFEATNDPIFSPNGKQLVYAGLRNGRAGVVVNGRETQTPFPFAGNFVFSPDCQRMAYIAAQNTKSQKAVVVVDGNAGKAFDQILMGTPAIQSKRQASGLCGGAKGRWRCSCAR